VALLLAAPLSQAATEAQAQALGQTLTPMGGERGANKDGSIPFFAMTLAATADAPILNLPDTCIRNMMPTTTRTNVLAIGVHVS